jgi:NAD-dependent deacetylase
MPSNVEAARDAVRKANAVAVLTGAGVSAESGIPTFRSNGGFWRSRRFEDLATPRGFARDPKMVWEWYEERRRGIAAARPNAGHEALVQMERQKDRFTLISQNVDGLHERAGSRSVIRLHGSIWTIRCTICGDEKTEFDELLDLPPRCGCGGIMRPGVVWFGEPLPENAIERAADEVRLADVFIVAGTSAQVYRRGPDPSRAAARSSGDRSESGPHRFLRRCRLASAGHIGGNSAATAVAAGENAVE